MTQCVKCNKTIPAARLKILPDTCLCVKCSEVVGGEYEVVVLEDNCGSSIVSKPVLHRIKKRFEKYQPGGNSERTK